MIRFLESALDVVGAAATATGGRFFGSFGDVGKVQCSMCWVTIAIQLGLVRIFYHDYT